VSTTPPSSSTIPTKNSSLNYTISTLHQSPFKGVNQWGTLVATLAFTPSLYIPLQAITFTPIYTMEVNSFFGRIKTFNGRPFIISLKEFKANFSTIVYELELKYGTNYIKVFAFKQLARYVHYEALDVYKQHSLKILDVTQIPNPAYATSIITASQTTL